MSRSEWNATNYDYNRSGFYFRPVRNVLICHTKNQLNCCDKKECIATVQKIQRIDREVFHEIKYNFLIGGDGNVYEGRGWDIRGNPAMSINWSSESLGIAFIGDFDQEEPTSRQLEAAKKLLKFGVENNKLAKDYELFGQYQIDVGDTTSPGFHVSKVIKTWEHWSP